MKPVGVSAAAHEKVQISPELQELAVVRHNELLGVDGLPEFGHFEKGLSRLSPAYDFLFGRVLEIGGVEKDPKMDVVFFQEPQERWQVGLISAAETPIFNNVSVDGRHGENATEAWQDLKEIPIGYDTSVLSREEIISRFSPTEAMYRALQEARIARGDRPVDYEDCIRSLARIGFGINKDEIGGLLTFSKAKNRVVKRPENDPIHYSERMGVRLSILSSDIR